MAQITRRSFMAAGIAGATALIAGGVSSSAKAADEVYDVVVVGGGGAGLSAAVEAADAGASVLVLDKSAVTGGTTAVSQGLIGGFGTAIQKAQGVELTYEQMYDNLNANASLWKTPRC